MRLNKTMLDQARQAGAASSLHRVVSLRAARRPWLHRLLFWGPVLALTALGTALAAHLSAGAEGWLRLPLIALVAANLLYLLTICWPSVLGALVHLFGGATRVTSLPTGRSRTAVLMTVHNESVAPVFAAVETMARAVAGAGVSGVDFFILSDTRDPAIAAQEEAAYAALRPRMPTGPGLFYRRRTSNERRKAGNVAEFCARWGHQYDYMVTLDADSLMGAEALRTLIGVMDANPRAGIVQTVPYSVGRETLFARAQQFAARIYAPLLIEGSTFWQQADGNYWGHNAIIRVRPFVEHCELPVLPGREPFGGEILCHDVVEAALMRRAGWEVWILPEQLDSFEALPANLVDYALRERRWCQGNLQHLGVLPTPGLGWVSRYHLGVGIAHYASGIAAVGFALLATLDAVVGGGTARALLLGGGPAWLGLLLVTGFALYGAKGSTVLAVLLDAEEARRYGGRLRLVASALFEQACAFVVSAVMLVYSVRCIVLMLLGLSVRWDAQPRDDRGLSWRESWRCFGWVSLLGAGWMVLLALLDPQLLLWASPLALGMALAVPGAAVSSRLSLGRAARRAGLLLTPDETDPAPILRAYRRALALPPIPAPAGTVATRPATVPALASVAVETGDGD